MAFKFSPSNYALVSEGSQRLLLSSAQQLIPVIDWQRETSTAALNQT